MSSSSVPPTRRRPTPPWSRPLSRWWLITIRIMAMRPHNHARLSWRRQRALCGKETRQILRDPSSGLIAFVIPLMLLFIFGYGINLDSSRLHVGILMEQQSADARDLAYAFAASPNIAPTISDNRQRLVSLLQAGTIRGMIVIPVDFDRNMARDGN